LVNFFHFIFHDEAVKYLFNIKDAVNRYLINIQKKIIFD
jgi:hypothetical protein